MDETTNHAIERIFEKLDKLSEDQGQIGLRLGEHVAREQEWQENITEKIDSHVEEHRASTAVWRKGVVGVIFMLVGSFLVWASQIIWSHKA
jgi:hypothetical protein